MRQLSETSSCSAEALVPVNQFLSPSPQSLATIITLLFLTVDFKRSFWNSPITLHDESHDSKAGAIYFSFPSGCSGKRTFCGCSVNLATLTNPHIVYMCFFMQYGSLSDTVKVFTFQSFPDMYSSWLVFKIIKWFTLHEGPANCWGKKRGGGTLFSYCLNSLFGRLHGFDTYWFGILPFMLMWCLCCQLLSRSISLHQPF